MAWGRLTGIELKCKSSSYNHWFGRLRGLNLDNTNACALYFLFFICSYLFIYLFILFELKGVRKQYSLSFSCYLSGLLLALRQSGTWAL